MSTTMNPGSQAAAAVRVFQNKQEQAESTQRPQLALIGDASGVLATQVGAYVDLSPFSGSLATGQNGLLIDGKTATKLDKGVLAGVLQSGALLAISQPTTEHMTILRTLTGQAPAGKVALVSYKKATDKPGYKCVLVPYGNVTTNVVTESNPIQTSSVPAAIEIGPHLAQAALDSGTLGVAPPGLVPPQGSMCGYSSFQSPCPWDPGYPNINGAWDDNTAKQNTQPVNSQYLTEFFVYWVNGGNAPYYAVILRQTGSMAIGNVLANSQDSRGWFQLMFQILPNTVNVNGNPITSGIQLAEYSPQNASNQTQIPVTMQVEMTLNANTNDGSGPVPFTATVQSALNYPNWGVLDQSSGGATAWQCYQTSGWNPVQYPPSDANTWWSNVYNNGNVDSMPDESFGSISFEMVTCWTFSPPLFTAPTSSPFNPPPSCWLEFGGSWEQWLGFIHNHPGCHGAQGGEHFHIFWNQNGPTWAWTIDIGGIAAQQNIG